MAQETIEQDTPQLPTVITPTNMALSPVGAVAEFKANLNALREFVGALFDDEDQGVIPGTQKPTLLKPGADKLCEFYGFFDDYEILEKTIDWAAEPPLFDYELKCTLYKIDPNRPREQWRAIATGVGCCSSWESKYRYRNAKRACPECKNETINRSKFEDKKTKDKGWYCHSAAGGCGTQFHSTDERIVGQVVGRVPNPDIVDQKNTVLKMAKKRAKIDATLSATRSAGIFTQDMEDFARGGGDDDTVDAEVSKPNPKPKPPTTSTSTDTATGAGRGSGKSSKDSSPSTAKTEKPDPKTTKPESSVQDAELDSLFTDNQPQDAEIVDTTEVDGDVPECLANFMQWVDAERVINDPPIEQVKVALTGIYESLLPGQTPDGKSRGKEELNKFMSGARVPDAPVSEWLTWAVATDCAMNAYNLSRS